MADVKKIAKSILMSSVLSLIGTHAKGAAVDFNEFSNGQEPESDNLISSVKNKIQKNVLKMGATGKVRLIAGHRSHRSHSSHRSSSSGSYSGSSSRSSSSSTSSSYIKPATPAKTAATYVLGDRTLKEGIYGNDVLAFTDLLISKKYLNKNHITKRSNYVVFDANVRNAVIQFQNDAKLTTDGIVSTNTISALQNWDSNKTTLVLGVRDVALSDSGDDINKLIELLTKAGFAPNPKKLEYDNNGKAKYTNDVIMAVKLFQAHNELEATGKVDSATILKLKSNK